MRTKALILFFPFAVFLTETISFIPAMKAACTIVAKEKKPDVCSLKNEESTCCAMMKQHNECNKEKENGEIPEEKDCNDNADCSTCPVCYTFIFQTQYEWTGQEFLCKKDYWLINTDHISNYIPDVWKPPNGTL